jgi:hypothetical protein
LARHSSASGAALADVAVKATPASIAATRKIRFPMMIYPNRIRIAERDVLLARLLLR